MWNSGGPGYAESKLNQSRINKLKVGHLSHVQQLRSSPAGYFVAESDGKASRCYFLILPVGVSILLPNRPPTGSGCT